MDRDVWEAVLARLASAGAEIERIRRIVDRSRRDGS